LDKSIDYSNLVVISSYLVYFKRTKDCFELTLDAQLNSYEGSQPLINILNMNAEDELYWNSFINIMKENPNIIKLKNSFFNLAFGLNKNTKSDKFTEISKKISIRKNHLQINVLKQDDIRFM
jgi:hypothetical protein